MWKYQTMLHFLCSCSYLLMFLLSSHFYPHICSKWTSYFFDPPCRCMAMCAFWLCLPSVLWHCWLGDSKGIWPVKTEWWVAGIVICPKQGADLHMAQMMPLPLAVTCFSINQIGFTFLVPAHPVKWVCVCVCVCVYVITLSVKHTHTII